MGEPGGSPVGGMERDSLKNQFQAKAQAALRKTALNGVGLEVAAHVEGGVAEGRTDILNEGIGRAPEHPVHDVERQSLELDRNPLGDLGVLEDSEVDSVDRVSSFRVAAHSQ